MTVCPSGFYKPFLSQTRDSSQGVNQVWTLDRTICKSWNWGFINVSYVRSTGRSLTHTLSAFSLSQNPPSLSQPPPPSASIDGEIFVDVPNLKNVLLYREYSLSSFQSLLYPPPTPKKSFQILINIIMDFSQTRGCCFA